MKINPILPRSIFALWVVMLWSGISAYSTPVKEGDVYHLQNAEDLLWFAKQVSVNGQSFMKALLTDDINLTGIEWVPIGKDPNQNSFWGKFDGGGHTVSGLNLTTQVKNGYQCVGFFGSLTHGSVCNLTVKGTITLSGGNNAFAGLIARAWDAQVENVHSQLVIKPSDSGYYGIGGVVGYAHDITSINNCSFSGSMQCSSSDAYGGIVGRCAVGVSLTNVANYGSLSANHAACIAGGIAGVADTEDFVLQNSLNVGRIEGDGNQVSALVGEIRSFAQRKCKNNYWLDATAKQASSGKTMNETYSCTMSELISGKVTYKLNEGQENTYWYQTIGPDAYPLLDSSHQEVFREGDKYVNTSSTGKVIDLVEKQLAYCDSVVAQNSIVDVYREVLLVIQEMEDEKEMLTYYYSLDDLRALIQASSNAYVRFNEQAESYRKMMNDITTTALEKQATLRTYLEEYVEPCETYPQGSLSYILKHHILGESGLAAECVWMANLFDILQNPQYSNRTDATPLLINPDFSQDFYGWQYIGCRFGWSESENLAKVEVTGDSLEVFQVLTGLKNGVYLLQMKGMCQPAQTSGSESLNHAATIYANNLSNYLAMGAENDGKASISHILTNVTDGCLFVGVKYPYTGNTGNHILMGETRLYYYGEISQAQAALNDVLASQTARATTLLLRYQPSNDKDYLYRPNFYSVLKDQLRQTIEEVELAQDNTHKYELVERYSRIFKEIFDCKMAYTDMMTSLKEFENKVENQMKEFLSEEQREEYLKACKHITDAYSEGTYSAEDARKLEELKSLSFMAEVSSTEPPQKNGYYQISNASHLMWFAETVNNGNGGINAQLVNDINMLGVLSWAPIGVSPERNSFSGTFDGQGHTLSGFFYSSKLGDWGLGGLFGSITHGTVKNLHVKGKMICQGGSCSMFGTIARAWNTKITNVHSSIEFIAQSTGYFGFGGITGYAHDGTIIEDCSFDGSIECNSGDSYGGIAGNTAVTTSILNCANYGSIINHNNGNRTGGLVGVADDASFRMQHCLNIGIVSSESGNPAALVAYLGNYKKEECFTNGWLTNVAPRDFNGKTMSGTFEVSSSELTSGSVCYKLNEEQEHVHWYQTIGEDPYPILNAEHGCVEKKGNNYINTGINNSQDESFKKAPVIFDLYGRRVQRMKHGLYIVDGKKMILQ